MRKKVSKKLMKTFILGGIVIANLFGFTKVYAKGTDEFILNEKSIKYVKDNPVEFILNEKDITYHDTKNITKVEDKKNKTYDDNTKKVYLSQSTQYRNLYYSKDISEGEKMGSLSKIVENKLKEKGVEVYVNDSTMDYKESLKYGNNLNINAYVALHSNAKDGQARGPLTIRSNNEKDIGLAEEIYENLISIYPYPNLGRGVMINNNYAETSGTKAPSTIVEVAFHDNKHDEQWINDNLENIGTVIANGIYNYLTE